MPELTAIELTCVNKVTGETKTKTVIYDSLNKATDQLERQFVTFLEKQSEMMNLNLSDLDASDGVTITVSAKSRVYDAEQVYASAHIQSVEIIPEEL